MANQTFTVRFQGKVPSGPVVQLKQSNVDLMYTLWVNGKHCEDMEPTCSVSEALVFFGYYFERKEAL